MAIRALSFHLDLDGVDTSSCRVTEFEVREALSLGCRGTILLSCEADLTPKDLLGKKVHLALRSGDDEERHFHGVVLAARREAITKERSDLWIEFGARVELLRLGRDSRIFQAVSAKEIATRVLGAIQLAGEDLSWELKADPPRRDYTVQHAESDARFLARLLASEGIAFAVRNDAERDRLHLFDDLSRLPSLEGDAVLPDRATVPGREDTVWALTELARVTSDAVVLRDYDLENPARDLTASEQGKGSRGLEVYLHPGGFRAPGRGQALAQTALERALARSRGYTGETDCLRLEPGRTFTVDRHPRAALNRELLLVEVVHRADDRGGKTSYENAFRAVPSDLPWRPEVPAPPRVAGLQVAFASGPAGAELHGSKFGQVKVRFPWDRSGISDDRSSTWLRVGQLALGGALTVPRVGFEVLVDFEMGEIDRPFVVGHLYNGAARPPYELPAGATRSSLQTATTAGGAGANELRFEDSAGAEEILVNASYDYVNSAEHDAAVQVAANHEVKVTEQNEVAIDANENGMVTGDRKLEVAALDSSEVGGDLSVGVKGNEKLQVGAVRSVTVQGDLTEGIQGSLTREVGALQSVTAIAGIQRKVAGSATFQVGGAWLTTSAASLASNCAGSRTELVGGLKMVKAKTIAVAVQGALAVTAAAELVKCGGNRNDSAAVVSLNAGGGLSVKAGKGINLTGEDLVLLQIGASSIRVTPDQVVLKGPQVKASGAKIMSSTSSHKSG